jgi:hypothetical protein
LSVPVPVIKIVKVKVTYFPYDLKKEGGIKSIELNVNDNLSLTTVEKMIQKELK